MFKFLLLIVLFILMTAVTYSQSKKMVFSDALIFKIEKKSWMLTDIISLLDGVDEFNCVYKKSMLSGPFNVSQYEQLILQLKKEKGVELDLKIYKPLFLVLLKLVATLHYLEGQQIIPNINEEERKLLKGCIVQGEGTSFFGQLLSLEKYLSDRYGNLKDGEGKNGHVDVFINFILKNSAHELYY